MNNLGEPVSGSACECPAHRGMAYGMTVVQVLFTAAITKWILGKVL